MDERCPSTAFINDGKTAAGPVAAAVGVGRPAVGANRHWVDAGAAGDNDIKLVAGAVGDIRLPAGINIAGVAVAAHRPEGNRVPLAKLAADGQAEGAVAVGLSFGQVAPAGYVLHLNGSLGPGRAVLVNNLPPNPEADWIRKRLGANTAANLSEGLAKPVEPNSPPFTGG